MLSLCLYNCPSSLATLTARATITCQTSSIRTHACYVQPCSGELNSCLTLSENDDCFWLVNFQSSCVLATGTDGAAAALQTPLLIGCICCTECECCTTASKGAAHKRADRCTGYPCAAAAAAATAGATEAVTGCSRAAGVAVCTNKAVCATEAVETGADASSEGREASRGRRQGWC